MLMLSLDDAVDVTRRLVQDEIDDVTIIRQELEQKCWFPPEANEAAKRLNDLFFDINPAEICSQIESDNLREWCRIVQTEMKMAMVQLPCWAEQQWIPCSEKEAEYPCLACDVFGQIFITNNGIVRINGECYDGTGFDFSNAEEFLKGIKVGNSMRMLPRKIVAWSPLPEPYGEDDHETD